MADPEDPDKPKKPPKAPRDDRTVIAPAAFQPEPSQPPEEDAEKPAAEEASKEAEKEAPVEEAAEDDPWGTGAAAEDGEAVSQESDEPPAEGAEEDAPSEAEAEPDPEEPPAEEEQTNSPLNLVGTVINNNYKITELVNAGGMGEVYRGENVHTGDEVAIKIVLPNLAHEEKIITLFRREARILFNLMDEAIVRYYNFVKDADLDRFCLIMEFVDGEPLSDRMEAKGPLSLEDTRVLIRRLASGLSRAHTLEVTHRDLSPDNVILEDGSVAHAKLIDFGIAKSTEITEGTLHGQFAGKFNFVSPEQLGHYDGIIDGRTDIYGLGLMAAGAARGKALDMGTSIVEAVNSRREIPDLSEVYEELRPILSHMLEPDPADRPASMDDVVAMIDSPANIPVKYRGDDPLPLTEVVTPSPGGAAQTTAPGVTAPGVTGVPPGGEGDSPFGVSMPPVTTAPTPLPSETPEEPKKSGLSPMLMVLGLLVLGGLGAGAYVMTQGGDDTPDTPSTTEVASTESDPDTDPGEEDPDSDPGEEEIETASAGTTTTDPPDESETETETEEPEQPSVAETLNDMSRKIAWVDDYDGGNCVYNAVRASTSDKIAIEGFGTSVQPFERLMSAFQREMGSEPDIGVRIVNDSQCPVLEFVKALKEGDTQPPVLTLDADVLVSGDTLSGRLTGVRGRPVWLFLVSGKGGVFDITSLLERQDDGSSRFGFGMTLAEDDEPTPQMVVAVTTQTPLVTVRAAKAGANAAQLLRIVETEIETSSNPAAATVKYFRLDR